jgi:excisionase family DNA binding protein
VSDPLLISQGEACRRLNVSRPTLIAEIKAGRLRYVRVGRRRKFKPSELEAYIERQVQGWDETMMTGLSQRRSGGRPPSLQTKVIGFAEAVRVTESQRSVSRSPRRFAKSSHRQ